MKIAISKIKPNNDNPRFIKDNKYKKLVQSIKDFPQMLDLRPIVVNSDMMVLGGNMRLRACKEAGLKQVPVSIATDLTEEQQKEFIIKDNVGFGEWDWDILANEWDTEQLKDWGLEIKSIGENIADEEWVGMPDFEQEDITSKNRIIVTFRNDEDRMEFGKLIGQNVTEKTKSLWHPKLEQDEVADLRY
jgi:hypothetical protein